VNALTKQTTTESTLQDNYFINSGAKIKHKQFLKRPTQFKKKKKRKEKKTENNSKNFFKVK